MKTLKFLLTLFISIAFSFVAGAVGESVGVNPFLTGGAVFGSSLIPSASGVLKAGINVEIWHNFIVENLFKNNQFLEKSVDVSGFVLNGAVVHIPNAGIPSNVQRNRQNLPASIKRRIDTDIVYALDEFTSDPVAILRADEVELSYNKMESVLSEDMAKLKEIMAEWMLYNWKPEGSANMILTTGGSTPAHLSTATGNRKKFTIAELRKAQTLMNQMNLPKQDRYALFDSIMYEQLQEELSTTQYRDFSSYFNAESGVVGRLYGFDIYERSTVLRLNNSNVVKSPDAAEATTDRAGVLVWQKNQVEKAVGNVLFFDDKGNPTMYGDIYSFLVRAGGRKRRADNSGVIAIVQDNA